MFETAKITGGCETVLNGMAVFDVSRTEVLVVDVVVSLEDVVEVDCSVEVVEVVVDSSELVVDVLDVVEVVCSVVVEVVLIELLAA